MKIITAEHSGFCYGVKRAVAMAEECIGKTGMIHTLGPIIHNPQMVRGLQMKVLVLQMIYHKSCNSSTVIIRSHGVGPEVYEQAQGRKIFKWLTQLVHM